MPAVAVGVAAGYTATTIATISIGTAIGIGVAAAGATHLLMDSLTPEMGDFVSDPAADQAMNTNPNEPRKIIYGEQVVGGKIVGYAAPTINGKDYHIIVLHLVGHPCESVDIYEIEGLTASELGTAVGMNVHLGDQTEVDSLANQYVHGWTDNHIGYNQTYVVLKAEMNDEKFPQGLNEAKFIVRGHKVYDPRKDSTAGGSGSHRSDDESTWEWSDNPELCAYDCLRRYGARPVPERRIPWDFVSTAASYCEESVNYTDKDGNPQSGQRFAVNGVLNNSVRPGELLKQIMSTMGARPYRVGGKVYIKPAMYAGPATVTVEVNSLSALPEYRPHRPYREKLNTVRAEYLSPEKKWQMTGAPVVHSPAYKAKDKAHLEDTLRLQMVTKDHQAQRLAKLKLERSRAGFFAYYPLPGIRLDLVPGTNARFVDAQTGIDKEFLVEDIKFDANKNVTNVSIVEDGEAIYPDSFEPAEGDLTPNTTLPDATAIAAPHSLLWTPTPNDSWRQGVLTWDHVSPASVISYTVFIVNEDGTPETAMTFTTASREQSVNHLPVGTFTAAVSARNRFKPSPGVTKTFNVGVPSTPVSNIQVTILPGRVIIKGPDLPHNNATYEWRYLFEDDFANALEGGRNTGITVTNTPHDGILYLWYRLVDGDLADPNWLSVEIPDLIGLTDEEVTPELIGGLKLPSFPNTIFDTLKGFTDATAQSAEAIDNLDDTFESILASMAGGLVSESQSIDRDIGLRAKVEQTESGLTSVQTSVEQKADAVTIEAIRVNLQSQIDNAVFGDQTEFVNAKLGELEGRVEDAEFAVSPEQISSVVEAAIFEQDLATVASVTQQINALGIENYVQQVTFDEQKTRIDAAEEVLQSSLFRRSLTSYTIADDADEELAERLLAAKADLLLSDNERLDLKGAFAFAREQIELNTDEISAEALRVTQLETVYDGEFASAFQQIRTASNANQQTAQELTQFKVQAETDIAGAKAEAIAEAQEEITATVGYCTLNGNLSGHTDKASCEAAGGTWEQLPLAQAFQRLNLTITKDGEPVTGTAGSLLQLLTNELGNIAGRAFFGLDINGRVTGLWVYDEQGNPQLGTIDLLGGKVRLLNPETGQPFISWDTVNQVANIEGIIKLADGTIIGSVEDIRAEDGEDGENGSSIHRLVLRNGVFPSSTIATSDFISAFGRAPVLDDILIYVSADETASSYRRYNGSAWSSFGAIFHGDMFVKGTVAGDRFAAGTEITSPIIKGGLIKAGALEYGSARILNADARLCPILIDDFAFSRSNDRINRTVTLPQLMGPAVGNQYSFDIHRVAYLKADILLNVIAATDSSQSAALTVTIKVTYEMADTSHPAHNVEETVKTATFNPNSGYHYGTVPLLYRYTTRDEDWTSLTIRVVGASASTSGRPLALQARYTIHNNMESGGTAHTSTGDDNDAPNPPPPTFPPGGGGYEP